MSSAIVWFRNDLRLHDHEPLIKALEKHQVVIPFFCFDEKDFQKTTFGFEKTGNHRAQFQIESVENLKHNLQQLGSDLIIRHGKTAKILASLATELKAEAIYAYKDIHSEEIQIQKELVEGFDEKNIHYSFGAALFHINDLPHHYKETPSVFTNFRKAVEKNSTVREIYEAPITMPSVPNSIDRGQLPSLKELELSPTKIDDRAAIVAKGGESEALERLTHYFFKSNELSQYKKKRNGLLGADYSSKLSLWLWNGCISPRKIYWEVQRYENEVKKNQSTYWLIFELIWRDYFKYIALKHGNDIFQLNGIKEEQYEWLTDRHKLDKWANGETGVPFIDANMKELNLSGFMSNRGRQNVASFLVKELGLDWRMGAEYFESKLTDYDVASNYGNWMYIAGVGNDPRDRYFNIMLQAKRYDAEGKYVKHWLPELQNVESSVVHHPWTMQNNLFEEEKLNYPKPMVEPEYWQKHY